MTHSAVGLPLPLIPAAIQKIVYECLRSVLEVAAYLFDLRI